MTKQPENQLINVDEQWQKSIVVGIDQYTQWIDALPAYLRDGFVKQRLEQNTRPLLDSLKSNLRLPI